jgi:hypothetical protein
MASGTPARSLGEKLKAAIANLAAANEQYVESTAQDNLADTLTDSAYDHILNYDEGRLEALQISSPFAAGRAHVQHNETEKKT